MRTTICRILGLFLLVWLIPGASADTSAVAGTPGAGTANQSAVQSPTDAASMSFGAKVWNWAVEEWKPENLPADRTPLIRSLPELFAKDWNSAPDHRLSDGEKKAIRLKLKETALAQLDKEESRLLLERDRVLLVSNSVESDLVTVDKGLAEVRKKKLTATAMEMEKIPLPDKLPLKRGTSSSGLTVLERTGAGAQAFGETAGMDYLFTGKVRETGGYLHVELELWSVVEKRSLGSWQEIFAPEEAADRLAIARRSFQEILLGRPWASLEIEADPPQTRLVINEKQTQMVPFRNPFGEPAPVHIKAVASGYQEKNETLDLQPSQVLHLHWSLEKGDQKYIAVDSDPSGAGLWVDSQYLGKTPLKIPSPLYTVRLKLSLKDYLPLYRDIPPDNPPQMLLTLEKEKKGMTIQEAKDRFYLSLACFSVSLTTTIFLKTFSEQYGTLTSYYAANYSSDSWNNLILSSYTQQGLQGCYYGGIALTSGVFVWMMFELGNYLSTAEDPLR